MRTLMILHSSLLMLWPLMPVCMANETEEATLVSIPDDSLRKVITETLTRRKIKADVLTSDVMAKIRYINAANQGIKSLEGLQHCKNLSEIYLSGNEIADLQPLSDCVKVKSLDLSANRISNVTPLAKLVDLRVLKLDHNQIEDLALGNFAKLGALYASHNQLNSLESLTQLAELHSLYVSDNKIKDVSSLQTMPQLSSLDLRNNAVKTVSAIAKLKRLRWTFLSNNQIEDLSVFVEMAKADARQEFSPFWRIFVDDNPLNSEASNQLAVLRKFGINVFARNTEAKSAPAAEEENLAEEAVSDDFDVDD